MEAHPIAKMFPIVQRSELEELAQSIKERGLRNPIVLWEGMILDGRNRYLACKLAGVEPTYTEYDGPPDDWKTAGFWVLDQNLSRRHLTENQRSFAANRLTDLVVGRPKKAKKGAPAPITRAQAASRLGTTEDQVKRASIVERSGVPELVEAAEEGKVTLSGAAEVAKLPPEKQREVVAGGREAVSRAAADARAARAAKAQANPSPIRELSPEQKAVRAGQRTDAALHRLAGAIQVVKAFVHQLGGDDNDEDDLVLGAAEWKILTLAAREMRTAADWIETLAKGGRIDDQLRTLLDGNT